jgi:hypothetical protein
MRRTFVVLAALAGLCPAGSAAPDRAAKDREGTAALEAKLHGEWAGEGPCTGGITFRADGTYERIHQGPAATTSAGTWKVRWDALPPTLVLACRESDDPDHVGQVIRVKLVQLDETVLAFTHPDSPPPAKPTRFSRAKK